MDLYQLDCFRTVRHMEHISNAAVVLHITQPALSKIITRVEEYAGAPLFDRVKGQDPPECQRHCLLETLDGVFDQIEKGKKQVVDISEQNSNYSPPCRLLRQHHVHAGGVFLQRAPGGAGALLRYASRSDPGGLYA